MLEQYFQPKTINEAVFLLTEYGEEAKIFAGGTDLMPLMRTGALKPKYLIDLARITGLDYITYDKMGVLSIGALTILRSIEISRIVKEKYSVLCEAIHQMAWPRIRNMGTLSGNICRASPSADTAPPLLVLESEVKTVGPIETKIVPIKAFFVGPGKTVLKHNELVCEIRIPTPPAGAKMAFVRIARTAGDLATVNVASLIKLKDGICEDVRIALGGVAPTPVRVWKAEEVIKGRKPIETLIAKAAGIASDEIKPITDIRSTAEYRREVCKVLIKQAINRSLGEIGEQVGD
jgi:CO/xanthine dehydrogenase FAD-binding subunit